MTDSVRLAYRAFLAAADPLANAGDWPALNALLAASATEPVHHRVGYLRFTSRLAANIECWHAQLRDVAEALRAGGEDPDVVLRGMPGFPGHCPDRGIALTSMPTPPEILEAVERGTGIFKPKP